MTPTSSQVPLVAGSPRYEPGELTWQPPLRSSEQLFRASARWQWQNLAVL